MAVNYKYVRARWALSGRKLNPSERSTSRADLELEARSFQDICMNFRMLAMLAQICPIISMKHDLNDTQSWNLHALFVNKNIYSQSSVVGMQCQPPCSVKRKRENRTRLEFIKQLIIRCLHICSELVARVPQWERNFNCLRRLKFLLGCELISGIARLQNFLTTFLRNLSRIKYLQFILDKFRLLYCWLNLSTECFNVD